MAQTLLLLLVGLNKDHDSPEALSFLSMCGTEVLNTLRRFLITRPPPGWTKRDTAQFVSIVRGIFEMSGGKKDPDFRGYAGEYTVKQNSKLLAAFFGVTKVNTLEGTTNSNQSMLEKLSKSPRFRDSLVDSEEFEAWQADITRMLPLRFGEEQYQVRYSRCLHSLVESKAVSYCLKTYWKNLGMKRFTILIFTRRL